MTPLQWIERLQLVPHPEGGHYREFYRSPLVVRTDVSERSAVTVIHFLLQHGEHSRWHVVQSDEIWRHSAGTPLELLVYAPADRLLTVHRLGSLDVDGAQLTHIVPAGHWQAAHPLGELSLVECTVAPGFDFADFRMVADIAEHADPFDHELRSLRHLL